jgi:hypothetical protein
MCVSEMNTCFAAGSGKSETRHKPVSFRALAVTASPSPSLEFAVIGATGALNNAGFSISGWCVLPADRNIRCNAGRGFNLPRLAHFKRKRVMAALLSRFKCSCSPRVWHNSRSLANKTSNSQCDVAGWRPESTDGIKTALDMIDEPAPVAYVPLSEKPNKIGQVTRTGCTLPGINRL